MSFTVGHLGRALCTPPTKVVTINMADEIELSFFYQSLVYNLR
jgi:hypothetical protein